ncbi:Transcription factor, fungi [Ophiocordyceps sinensis CO18]|uniref:Transcription factor, fungi n=1 Tax=Ophiocordyceps sinensis (strain Co18 / CGMCC 3.14243) TaxID=911162 RepID=T5AKK3_OPHSC|nr:Transcription factor, fungi [Ophiocordyceps sinensis CO18]
MSRSPSRPPSPITDRPRPRPVSRACDRCRRRKAKCDYVGAIGNCTHCRGNHVRCTFDLPLARRGPKAKKKADALPSGAHHRPLPSGGGSSSSATSPAVNPSSIYSPPVMGQGPTPTPSAPGHAVLALSRWRALSRAVQLALPDSSLERTVTRCFHLFFEYLYPLTPLVHEPSLRDGLDFFLAEAAVCAADCPPTWPHSDLGIVGAVAGVGRPWSRLPGAAYTRFTGEAYTGFTGESYTSLTGESYTTFTGESLKTWADATFALVTAVCAEAAFLLPKELFPEGERVADVFLQASRGCLAQYLEADLENPNANSIAIRYFHSNCVHAAGKPRYSWHIFGEATRLAQVMHLHDESSLEGLHPVEAELRRRAFWIVYMGDKSAAVLNNRPITLHKFSFESGITMAYPTGLEASGIGQDPEVQAHEGRRSFIHGFNANLRLWQAASDVVLEIRLFGRLSGRDEDDRRRDMMDRVSDSSTSPRIAVLCSWQCSAIQCANLRVSFHCLRMVINQKFEDMSYFSPGAEQADLRKTEIVRDMLRVMREAPFWSLQVNGEPYVEKIRLMGASLLAIIHRNQTSPLGARARSDFSILLDVLTRLDSRASDALIRGELEANE